jgi:hypothetical protein
MPRTVESIIEAHTAADHLRQSGKSIWPYQLHLMQPAARDVAYETIDPHALKEKASDYAAAIEHRLPAAWLDMNSDDWDEDLDNIYYDLKDFDPVKTPDYHKSPHEQMKSIIDRLYDWGDTKRVWIKFKYPAAATESSITPERPAL